MFPGVTLSKAFVALRALSAAALMLLAMALSPAFAATWFVGPTGTVKGGDGTEAAPFSSIGGAFGSGRVVGGDTLLLLDGAYGNVEIKGVNPASAVVIKSFRHRRAQFETVYFAQSSNIVLSGVQIVPKLAMKAPMFLVLGEWNATNITIENSSVHAHVNAHNFRQWTAAEWQARASDAITMRGSGARVIGNSIMGVNFGITLNGTDSLAERNTVNGFNGDGLRGNNDRITFRANLVTNCVFVGGNHDDGFQSFNLRTDKRPFDGLVIDRNIFVEWTDAVRGPLACELQGIGMFDGMFSNLTITNNLVVVSAYHGITVTGATNVLIANNTVALPTGIPFSSARRPWIMVANHKDGRQSTGITIANNVTVGGVLGQPGTIVGNIISTDGAVFRNPATFDFRPRAGTALVDAADAALASAVDLTGRKRMSAPDVGAYEAEGRWLRIN